MYCWQNQQANYLIERAYYAECADYTPMMSDESRQTIENAFFETEKKGKRTYNMWQNFENMKAQQPNAVGEMYQQLMFFAAAEDESFARRFAQEAAFLTYLEFARTLIMPIHIAPVEPINTQPDQEGKQQPQKKEPLVKRVERKISELAAHPDLEKNLNRFEVNVQNAIDKTNHELNRAAQDLKIAGRNIGRWFKRI